VLNSPQVDLNALRALIQAFSSFGNLAGVQRAVDKIEAQTNLDATAVLSLAQAYAALANVPKLEATLEKLTKVMPTSPEAWYDLAVLKAGIGKTAEGLSDLRKALDLSATRLQSNPGASNLIAMARKEVRFDPLRQSPEFKQLVSP
jgi:tetratricopeptide (TPR) repeat protein